MEATTTVYRFIVRPKGGSRTGASGPGAPGREARALAADAHALGLSKVRAVHRAALYFVRGTITPKECELLGRFLFCDPVVEDCSWSELGAGPPPPDGRPGSRRVEVALRPGVTDPVAAEALRAARELGVAGVEAVCTGSAFDVEGEGLEDGDLGALASRLLANAVVERFALGPVEPAWPVSAGSSGAVLRFDLAAMDDRGLLALSSERRAALDLAEMRAARDYFAGEGRPCTDAELETIAQTWSEHCVHKTFKARIEVRADEARAAPYPPVVDDVLKSYIKRASDEIAAPWVLSAFVDNAGVMEFDEAHEVSFKVETHNHPSAVEPFGGADTGVGGVIRDVMGVSARPMATTDVLCFGPPDAPLASLPPGALHPLRVARGVVAGVQDYGNKMGIPTVNGGVHYDPGYAANPLVYCGCAGIAPRGRRPRAVAPGDLVVVLGGRTGRDGLRGATFSSMVMDSSTGELSGASVQIGAPIEQKKVSEVLIEARDAGLYSAVTDCGAGGLSSAVGEMASALGADVDLAREPRKYPGLAPWEAWLSEAQERMVLAVPEAAAAALRALCEARDVEMRELGRFTGEGRLVVRNGGEVVIDLDCAFLHAGPPQRRLVASPPADEGRPAGAPARRDEPPIVDALLAVLAHPAVASKEATTRLYDHEVQGATVLRPYDGPRADGPQDAAVLRPRESSDRRGVALSNGFNQRYGALDPYRMAASAVDEAVRNAVAVGADPARLALLDNFCLGDPNRPEVMWQLIEAARACYEWAVAFRTPFISGKDSFNNEYLAPDGSRAAIPPSLLVSAMGIVPDVARAPGSDLKAPGDPLYLVGSPRRAFGGSVYAGLYGCPPTGDPLVPPPPRGAPDTYRALHAAVLAGLARACHDLSDGGLAAAIAEMCVGGRMGATLDLAAVPGPGDETDRLFGETNGCLLVEVAADREAEFARAMAGAPHARVGLTADTGTLAITTARGAESVSVESLARAFAGKGDAP